MGSHGERAARGTPAGEGGYLPIRDYGAIGNLRTVALVGRNGSIDWCCLPDLDRPSVFGALLDARRGGYFRVRPRGAQQAEQGYLPESNILESTFEAGGGRLSVVDFMPLEGDISRAEGGSSRPELYRLLRCEEGAIEVEVEWAPRLDYGRAPMALALVEGGFFATSGTERLALGGLPAAAERVVEEGEGGALARATFRLEQGEQAALCCRYGAAEAGGSLAEGLAALEATKGCWRRWVGRSMSKGWAGKWAGLVTRSELALKLLVYPESGAIAAAATTSLPEAIGGVRNWDYRFSWIRDTSLTVHALMAVGHTEEALAFVRWLTELAYESEVLSEEAEPQVLYGLRGERVAPEVILEHLEGYRGSRPVRVGNGAVDQAQHGVFGQLLNAVDELVESGERLDGGFFEIVSVLADNAAATWRRPDSGIWEMRGKPRHFVSSKWLVAVGLDRVVGLAERGLVRGDVARWRRERDAIREEVLARGYDEEVGAFVIAYGLQELDATNLLMPALGFLPASDPRVRNTIERTIERLTRDGHVYRYLMDDGLPGEEGAFVACTFWLVDALARAGRVAEARALFDNAARHANHVGLYAEEIDPRSGEFLGNFPQGLLPPRADQ